jgi:Ner family transcriptional regulator
MTLLDIIKKPVEGDWHPADVKAALEKKGWSLTRLSQANSYSKTLVAKALHRPYPNMEKIIGKALGTHPMNIWPSRYDENGRPNRLMGPRRKNGSTGAADGNAQIKRAA